MSFSTDAAAPAELFTFAEVPDEPRAKWFVKRGDQVGASRGFASKESAKEWIRSLGRRLDWQAGFVFRLRGDSVDMTIVDRAGVRAKP